MVKKGCVRCQFVVNYGHGTMAGAAAPLWKGNLDMDSKKRILLADADDVFRDLLRETLLNEPDFEIVGETGDGEEAVELCRRLSPDLLVMDLMLTQMDGLDVLDALDGAEKPAVLVLSALVRGSMAEAALADRCTATNPRSCTAEEIEQIFRKAYSGKLP